MRAAGDDRAIGRHAEPIGYERLELRAAAQKKIIKDADGLRLTNH
jgi:hypothetical protein